MIQNGKSDSINEYLFEKVMTKRNILYWQSGGPTSVINATAYGIDAVIGQKEIHKVYIAKNGIIGVINEEIYDVSDWSHTECSDLYQLPVVPLVAVGTNYQTFKIPNLRKSFPEY